MLQQKENTVNLSRLSTLVLSVAFLMSSAGIAAAAEQTPRKLKFASQSVGSTAYARTSAMAKVMNEHLPKGWSVEIAPISTGGVAGTLLTEKGAVDLAEGINVPNNLLRTGKYLQNGKPFPAPQRAKSILAGTDYAYFLIMFTEDFHKKSGCDTIEEVVAKKIPFNLVTKAPGSAGELGAVQLLESIGVTYDDIKKWGGNVYRIAPGQMADMLRENKADVSIDIVGLGQPAMSELTMTTTMYFPQLADSTLEKLATYGYAPKVMPSTSWNGQGRDLRTMVNSSAYVCDKDLPDEVVYAMVKAICENKDELVKLVPVMEQYDPSLSAEPALNGLELHPGAVKYYKEVGLIK